MNKKIISLMLVLVVCIISFISYYLINNKSNTKETNSNNTNSATNINEDTNKNQDNQNSNNANNNNTDRKVLVVYFSATNNTKNVAEKLANSLNGDTFEIEPVKEYTSEDLEWTNNNSRVSKEHNDKSLRNIELKTTKPSNWNNYDTILIGYPIWWGIAAWPVDTFVKENDFNGKTIYPFCTSASSGVGQSGKLLAELSNGGNWQEGHRFTSRPTDSDIKTFTDSIK